MLKRINKLRNGGKYEEMEGDTRVRNDTCTSASESNVTSDTASGSGVSDVATIEGKTMQQQNYSATILHNFLFQTRLQLTKQ